MSATSSGLQTIPLVFGVVIFSIISGQFISRTGKYKLWLYIGPIFLIVGKVFLITMDRKTPLFASVLYLLMSGIGVGCIIQLRVLGIQVSVKRIDNIAVATSTVRFID